MSRSILKPITAFLFFVLLGTSCTNKSSKQKAATIREKPNIIYILADDLGYGDLGCFGSTKIKTPNLDRMATEGMRFTQHYSGQTVCSPSRCSLNTGLHMGHASVRANGQLLDPNDIVIAELLKKAGYTTAAIGKWGLSEGSTDANCPNQKGFDYYFGFENQGFAHFYYPEFMWRNHTKVEYPENIGIRDESGRYIDGKGTYIHDEFTREAIHFIQKNKNKPFFLYLPYSIPHAELTVPKDSRAPYEKLGWPENPKITPGYKSGHVKDQGYGSQYKEGYCAQDQPNVTYAGMISRMDRDIGRIISLVDSLGLGENTIIMFGSDNGPSDEGGQDLAFFNSSGGFRGKKRDIYEGGIRTPFIVRWKGNIQPGTESDLISHFSDFLPTACELANVETPKTDGVSLLPTLLGKPQSQKQHRYLYWEWKNLQALRVGEWKFFYMNATKPNEKPVYELYNLKEDPAEQNNVVVEHPELVEKFVPYLKEARE